MDGRLINGSCHCGNISFAFTWTRDGATIPVRACSCAFCMKHGGVYTSDPGGAVKVTIADNDLVERYRFGTATADFFVCRRCGAVPLVASEIDGALYAVVNVNTFDDVDRNSFDSAVTDYDGEGTDDRLARRARNWTPQVEITTG